MADFCWQCTEELGISGNQNDFKRLISKKQLSKGLYLLALCEGCGPVMVDHEGKCVDEDCFKHRKE